MTLTEYFGRHLNGAWQLLRGNEQGLEAFDLSPEGFYRSFWAIAVAFALLVPIFIADHGIGVAFAAETTEVRFAMPLSVYVPTEVFVAAAGWAIFLVLMRSAAQIFGVGGRYSVFVIAYNWSSLLIVCLSLPLATAQLGGLTTWEVNLAIQFTLGLIFLVYSWFVARTALGLSGLDAAAVVALEILIVLLLAYPTEAFYAQFGA